MSAGFRVVEADYFGIRRITVRYRHDLNVRLLSPRTLLQSFPVLSGFLLCVHDDTRSGKRRIVLEGIGGHVDPGTSSFTAFGSSGSLAKPKVHPVSAEVRSTPDIRLPPWH